MARHMLYNWQYFDKRNRLTHNMIMEHFEMHVEDLQDVIVDMNTKGVACFDDLREHDLDNKVGVTYDDLALIDEMSGLTNFVEGFIQSHDMPEQVASRLRSRVHYYSGSQPKDVAMYELKKKLYGSAD